MPDEHQRINLSRIPKAQRAQAWAKLQKEHPAVAAWCRDPCVQEMRRAFDAELIVELPPSQ